MSHSGTKRGSILTEQNGKLDIAGPDSRYVEGLSIIQCYGITTTIESTTGIGNDVVGRWKY